MSVKRISLALILGIVLCLGGCMRSNQLALGVPETVEIEGDTYRADFYGDDLWIKTMEFTGAEYEVGSRRFRGVDCNGFSCVQADIGPKTNGVLYCLDSQWEDAAAYYGDPENFTYYCEIEATSSEPEHLEELEAVDLEQWDALFRQGQAGSYDPFDFLKNQANERKAVDFDTLEVNPLPYIRFYRASKDGVFRSFRGNRFFVREGALYLARYHNQSEHRLSAVQIPEETGAYFLEIIENVRSGE